VHVGGKDGAVGVRDENNAADVQRGEDTRYGEAVGGAGEDGACHVHADGKQLNGEDADVWVLSDEVGEKRSVWPQANTYAMDKKDGKFGGGTMGTVPIR